MSRCQSILAATVLGTAALFLVFPSTAQARTCEQVQTDLNAQYKARDMYQREKAREENQTRREELDRGIQGFDRNIQALRAEPCDGGTNGTALVPPPPTQVPSVPSPSTGSSGPCIPNLDGECVQ